MTGAAILFAVLALTAVASAVAMLFSRNSVYAALFLVMNFATVAIIYLTLGAPFIALAQITVYAGAIMILFLFVIMLLGTEKLPIGDPIRWQRPLGVLLGLLLMGEGVYVIAIKPGGFKPLAFPAADYASPAAIGASLFNTYLLPFEITSVLLLVAVLGAVVLTRPEKKGGEHWINREAQKPDLLAYEKEIEAKEAVGEYAGSGPDGLRRDGDSHGNGKGSE